MRSAHSQTPPPTPLLKRRGDTGPFPRATKALALAILLVGTLAVASNVVSPRPMDFVSYWAAARQACAGGAAAAYDLAAHEAVEAGAVALIGHMPFAYPPPFLIVLLPFGLLTYPAAAVAWIVGTYLLYLATAQRWTGTAWLAAAFPPVLVNAIIGQNGLLTAALLIGGTIALPRRPFVAGLLLGAMVTKPQLALFVPFALIAGSEWRAFAGAMLSSAALLLVALLLFGAQSYAAMIGAAPVSAAILSSGLVDWHKLASVYAALRLAGAPAGAALAIHAAVALAALVATCVAWRRPVEPGAKMATLVAASALASPYLYAHDLAMLIVPFVWLAACGADARLLAMLWCVPAVAIAQAFGWATWIDPLPLTAIGLLILLMKPSEPVRAEPVEAHSLLS